MKHLLCIDGNSILNRAYFGIRMLTTKDGFPTNALYGMVNSISHQMEALNPDFAVIAYDLHEPTFRHKMYDEYKAGRHAMPPELCQQMPVSREFARMLGLHILEMPGYEADDILGTVSAMAEAEGDCTAYLLTGDRDALQLISPRVHVLLAGNRETTDMDEATFLDRYGVSPTTFVDVKALMGDSSDHIPGVRGIGEKGALKLIAEFGSLDRIYANLDHPSLTPSLKKKLEEGKDSAYLSQDLARIRRNVPLGVELPDLKTAPMDREAATELFVKYEFSGFLKRFGLTGEAAVSPHEAEKPADSPSPDETVHVEDTAEGAGETPVGESDLTADALARMEVGSYAVMYDHRELSFCRSGKVWHCRADTDSDRACIGAFLNRPGFTWIAYDAKQLYHNLDEDGIRFRSCDFDVMLAAYVLHSDMTGFDPDRLFVTYLDYLPDTPTNRLNAVDKLCPILTQKLNETDQMGVFRDIEMPLAAVLCDMEEYGFKIDRDAMYRYGLILDTVASGLEERIYLYAGHPFNIHSPKQLGEILFETLQLPTRKKTKTGYSTSAEVLESLRPYHPIIEDILEYRQVTKLKSTYVDGLLKVSDGEGRVHSTFKQTGTTTGRISSAEPNLQNIPIRTELGRELRKFFIPSSEGRVLIDADYSQIELRLLSDIAKDDAMREAFRNGFDIHTDTACRVFGVTPENVTVELRKQAKAINFGIMYGMGEFSLSEDLHISRAEAKAYIDSYLNSYPDINRYLDDIVRSAYEKGYVTTKFGRRRYIPELAETNKMRKKFGERVAMNSPIQGTAADIIKLAMIRVHRRLQESGLDARMILQVHDELILDASVSCAEEALQLLCDEMEHACSLTVPLLVDAHIGENWFSAH